MYKKWLSTLPGCALVLLLSACGDDKPSDQLAADTIHKIADQEAYTGLAVVDFVRENGWVDDQATNRYKVRYNYNLKLVKPYAEVVLSNAQILRSDIEKKAKASGKGEFDVNAMQSGLVSLQLTMVTEQWINNQGDNFQPRFQKFVGACKPCGAYIYDPGASHEEQLLRFRTFLSSWVYFEELGFKDDHVVGDKIARQAWSSFMKTEKGWQPAT